MKPTEQPVPFKGSDLIPLNRGRQDDWAMKLIETKLLKANGSTARHCADYKIGFFTGKNFIREQGVGGFVG